MRKRCLHKLFLTQTVFVFVGWAFLGPASAQTSFLCIPDKVSGFYFNKNTKSWENTTFKTNAWRGVSRECSKPILPPIAGR